MTKASYIGAHWPYFLHMLNRTKCVTAAQAVPMRAPDITSEG